MADPIIAMNNQQFQQLLQAVGGANANNVGGGGRKLATFKEASPAEWRVWRKNFETISAIHGWNANRAKQEISAAMEGEAARTVHDIDIQAPATAAALLDLYQARLIPAAAGRLARAEFTTARQGTAETLIQWHSRLRELFQRAYPARQAAQDQQLIDQFVHQLVDTVIKTHVLDQGPATYAAALDVAQSKQATQALVTGKGNGEATIHAIGGQESTGRGRTTGNCWYCGQPGHLKMECAEFKRAEAYFNKNRADKNGGQQVQRGGSQGGRSWRGRGYGRGGKGKTGNSSRGKNTTGQRDGKTGAQLNQMGEDQGNQEDPEQPFGEGEGEGAEN